MRDKVILGITLSIVLLLTLVVYGFIDANRGPATQNVDLQASQESGRKIFAQYCIQCHGPQGEGCIGPALNRASWRPTLDNGAKNPNYDEAARENLIRKTIERGRNSNQPGVQMPAWSTRENGALNDEAIEDVINFIQYGDWNRVLEAAASANNLQEAVPEYPGYPAGSQKLQDVKNLMLAKGCLTCHSIGKGGGNVAADLTDVGSRRDATWLRAWIKDPKAMPPEKRGPNLFLVGPTVTVPPPSGAPVATSVPKPTAQAFPMNATFMPTIPLTDQELTTLVDYLSVARVSK